MNHQEFVRGWSSGLPETPCGAGSTLAATERQREVLRDWIAEYDVFTLADIGAGDLNWIQHMDWPHPVAYIPLDLVPRHPDVRQFDIAHHKPPQADMTLCLWVLNHLPEYLARKAVENLLAGSRLLVYTWWPQMPAYLDLGCDEAIIIKPRKAAELRLLKCSQSGASGGATLPTPTNILNTASSG